MPVKSETRLEELDIKFEAKIEAMQPLSKAREAILNRPPADDLINDLLPDSASAYMLICGRSGIGKTFLALNILFCLASGVPFLSHKTKQCKVGLLSMEGSDRKLLNRFDTIALSFPTEAKNNIFWHHTTAITGAHKLEPIINGLDVVIVDPLRPLIPGDYTSPKDANNFVKSLQQVQSKTGTKLILIHHIRKPDRKVKVHPEDLQFEVKGASEYVEAATTVLLMEKEPQRKDTLGRFLPRRSDYRILYFPKVKDAPTDLLPVTLRWNWGKMIFEPSMERCVEDAY